MVKLTSLVPGDIVVIDRGTDDESEIQITGHPRKYRGYGYDKVRVEGRTVAYDMLATLDGDPGTEVYVRRTEPTT